MTGIRIAAMIEAERAIAHQRVSQRASPAG
jgi:hypothetical protein